MLLVSDFSWVLPADAIALAGRFIRALLAVDRFEVLGREPEAVQAPQLYDFDVQFWRAAPRTRRK